MSLIYQSLKSLKESHNTQSTKTISLRRSNLRLPSISKKSQKSLKKEKGNLGSSLIFGSLRNLKISNKKLGGVRKANELGKGVFTFSRSKFSSKPALSSNKLEKDVIDDEIKKLGKIKIENLTKLEKSGKNKKFRINSSSSYIPMSLRNIRNNKKDKLIPKVNQEKIGKIIPKEEKKATLPSLPDGLFEDLNDYSSVSSEGKPGSTPTVIGGNDLEESRFTLDLSFKNNPPGFSDFCQFRKDGTIF